MRLEHMNRRRIAKRRRKLFPLPKRVQIPATRAGLTKQDSAPQARPVEFDPASHVRETRREPELIS
jgi:hypothetical protein